MSMSMAYRSAPLPSHHLNSTRNSDYLAPFRIRSRQQHRSIYKQLRCEDADVAQQLSGAGTCPVTSFGGFLFRRSVEPV